MDSRLRSIGWFFDDLDLPQEITNTQKDRQVTTPIEVKQWRDRPPSAKGLLSCIFLNQSGRQFLLCYITFLCFWLLLGIAVINPKKWKWVMDPPIFIIFIKIFWSGDHQPSNWWVPCFLAWIKLTNSRPFFFKRITHGKSDGVSSRSSQFQFITQKINFP